MLEDVLTALESVLRHGCVTHKPLVRISFSYTLNPILPFLLSLLLRRVVSERKLCNM